MRVAGREVNIAVMRWCQPEGTDDHTRCDDETKLLLCLAEPDQHETFYAAGFLTTVLSTFAILEAAATAMDENTVRINVDVMAMPRILICSSTITSSNLAGQQVAAHTRSHTCVSWYDKMLMRSPTRWREVSSLDTSSALCNPSACLCFACAANSLRLYLPNNTCQRHSMYP